MKKLEKGKRCLFIPLICSIAVILSLLGVDIIYKIKIDDASSKIAINLFDLFNTSLTQIWPIIVIIVSVCIGGLLPLFYFFKKFENNENISIVSTFIYITGLLFLIAYKDLFSYFAPSLIDNFKSADMGYGIGLAILFTSIGAISSLFVSPKKYGDNVKAITEDAMLIALAFALSFVKIPIGATGGSINFQMLPLFIIALRRGPLHCFISSGLVYGLLACLVDGYGFFTYPFDYLIGFGSAAILGLFRPLILDEEENFAIRLSFVFLGGFLATLLRFFAGTISSIVIYGYDIVPALIYNAIYIPVSGAISIAILMIFFKPFAYINSHYPIGESK